MLTHMPTPPNCFPSCLHVYYMHFAQILSFPSSLDNNKDNVNKNKQKQLRQQKLFCRQRFVCCCCCWGKTRSTLVCCCWLPLLLLLLLPAASVYPTNANQSRRATSMSVQQKCRLTATATSTAANWLGSNCRGTASATDWELVPRLQLRLRLRLGCFGCLVLPAVLNYKRSLFSISILLRHELPFCCCCCCCCSLHLPLHRLTKQC